MHPGRRTVFYRSAGACPPRSLHGEGQALALRANRRYRLTVARGPVPRDRWIARVLARETRSDARVASEGPSYDEEGAFCRSGPGRRAARLHRDPEVSPTGDSGLPDAGWEKRAPANIR